MHTEHGSDGVRINLSVLAADFVNMQADLARIDRQRVDGADPVVRRQHAPADDERTGGADAAQEQGPSVHARADRIAARTRG